MAILVKASAGNEEKILAWNPGKKVFSSTLESWIAGKMLAGNTDKNSNWESL